MKQKEVFKKIGGIIQELSEQYEYLKTVNEDLNDLELELFAANAHFLTDHIEVLCKLNLQSQAEKRTTEKAARPEKTEKPAKPVDKETTHEPKYFEPVVQQMKPGSEKLSERTAKEPVKPVELEIANVENLTDQPVPEVDLASEVPGDTFSFIREEPETIRHELVLDETMELDEDEKIETETEPVKESKKRKTGFSAPDEAGSEVTGQIKEDVSQAQEVPALSAEEEVLTINQKMSQAGEKNISRTEQIGIKPISDIKLAITLNDKLLYVKDLFNGYNLAYSEAIEILNRFSTFDEAARFLKTNYITKNNWESKPATVEKFYALLKRRYA
jgi:hypothetical protein